MEEVDLREKRQAVMEMAVMGVVAQGGTSQLRGRGRYNGPYGRHCHIGFFLDHPREMLMASGQDLGQLEEVGTDFLEDLQEVHDDCCGPRPLHRAGLWKEYSGFLSEFCKRWNLRYPGELL